MTSVRIGVVGLLIVAVLAAFGIAMHFAFPQFTDSTVKKANGVAGKLLERVAGMSATTGTGITTAQRRTA